MNNYSPVYVIHPYRGDGSPGSYERNLAEIRRICRDILNEGGAMPISPVLLMSYLDDAEADERETALEMCEELLRTVIDADGEVRVYGDWRKSAGCRQEIRWADGLGVRVWIEDSTEFVVIGRGATKHEDSAK